MAQQGSPIANTGLNTATNQTKVFDGKFHSNIFSKGQQLLSKLLRIMIYFQLI